MASLISDDELRHRLSSLLGPNQTIPPIVDSTRSLLLEKLGSLQFGAGELEIQSKDTNTKPVTKGKEVRAQPLSIHYFRDTLTIFIHSAIAT